MDLGHLGPEDDGLLSACKQLVSGLLDKSMLLCRYINRSWSFLQHNVWIIRGSCSTPRLFLMQPAQSYTGALTFASSRSPSGCEQSRA